MSAEPMDSQALKLEDWVRPELRDLKPYASARALHGDSSAVVALNANENPWPSDPAMPLNRYPDPQPQALVEALADHFDVDPASLLITRGSDEGIDLLMRLLIRPGTDSIMVQPPCFGMYALYAQIQGAKVIEVPLVKGRGQWTTDWPATQKADACRLYFFCTPNNPTGHEIPAVELLAFAKQVENHGLVVVDEAYAEFSEAASLIPMIAHQPNLVVLRTLSKAFGLAGARLGCVMADPDVVDWLKRIIAPYPLPTPSVDAALRALEADALGEQRAQIERILANKQSFVEKLPQWGFVKTIWPGQANFVLVEVDDADDLMAHCLQSGVVLRNQSHQPNLTNCIRITIGSNDEMNRLVECFNQFQPTQA